MTITSQLTQVAALVGFLLPIVIAKVIHENWKETYKKVAALAAIVIASVITAWSKGSLNWHDLFGTGLIIFTMTKTSYLSLWKGTSVAAPRSNTAATTTTP